MKYPHIQLGWKMGLQVGGGGGGQALLRMPQRGLNTKRPTIVFLLGPTHDMDRQARTGGLMLVMRREMTSRIQTLPWWLGGEGVKTTETKYTGSVGSPSLLSKAGFRTDI
jgi:hypothetical protein